MYGVNSNYTQIPVFCGPPHNRIQVLSQGRLRIPISPLKNTCYTLLQKFPMLMTAETTWNMKHYLLIPQLPIISHLRLFITCSFQLISNDKFKSVEHRVLANSVGPRVSAASFFITRKVTPSKVYGPIKELLSEANPPKYRETTSTEYSSYFVSKGLNGTSALLNFRL